MYGTYVWRFRHHGVTAPRGSATAPLFSVLPPSQLAMAVYPSISAPAAFLLLLFLTSAGLVESLSVVGRVRLKLGFGKALREDAVARYFEGVTTKNRELIASCFPAEGASIRDVCGLSQDEKTATRDQLADRCMEFVAAHPDCVVHFHHPPTALGGRGNRWVFAHWYETGTWSGESLGITPHNTPLSVEGQTRFLVNDDLEIERIVVTRTFSDWEKMT